jgi:hypothetical protein
MIKYHHLKPGSLLTLNAAEFKDGKLTGKRYDTIIELEKIEKEKNNPPHIAYEFEGLRHSHVLECDKIKPIPLTREWFRDFGFTQFANDAYHRPEMFTWRLWYDDTEKAAFYTTDVYPELGHPVYLPHRLEYVHELQSLFYEMTELMLNK